MTLLDRQLNDVWSALDAQSVHHRNALTEVRIRNLRGIRDLPVPFNYPVCVLAGPNGCGKSTVLLACACAYRVPGSRRREFVPSTLFPDFTGDAAGLRDAPEKTRIEFYYLDEGERNSMRLQRGERWNPSFMGRRNGRQPERQLYLRTLANLTNPAEVRSLLQLARKELQTEQITQDLLLFAHRVLPRRYRTLSQITAQSKDLLFAELEGGSEARYSEFHMSAGERAMLRISKDISNLHDALILIDEVEAGLHPYTQQQAMLEFQRIALRNRLQIIVTTHSPVVLESVPAKARLFLERDEATAEVRLVPPYRDILQKALYGQSRDRLSILCEDEVAEGVIRGFLDVLNVELDFRHDDLIIGRDTGRDEFPAHIRTLGQIGKLSDVILVLDGDSRDREDNLKSVAAEYGQAVKPLFLPGTRPPEAWIWRSLSERREHYSGLLGIAAPDMEQRMSSIQRMVDGAVRQRDPAKTAVEAFAQEVNLTVSDIARRVGQHEALHPKGEVSVFLTQLREQVTAWRQP